MVGTMRRVRDWNTVGGWEIESMCEVDDMAERLSASQAVWNRCRCLGVCGERCE